jgi:hypothetical protein
MLINPDLHTQRWTARWLAPPDVSPHAFVVATSAVALIWRRRRIASWCMSAPITGTNFSSTGSGSAGDPRAAI